MLLLNDTERQLSLSLTAGHLTTFILCGDCSGDELLPRKTVMTSDGRCNECGGRSFVLASELAAALRAAIDGRNYAAGIESRPEIVTKDFLADSDTQESEREIRSRPEAREVARRRRGALAAV